jgi:hypothetical protein
VNGDGGGIVTVSALLKGAVGGGSDLECSQLQRLLALVDEAGDFDDSL